MKWQVQGPDGKSYEVESPDGATEADVLARVKASVQTSPMDDIAKMPAVGSFGELGAAMKDYTAGSFEQNKTVGSIGANFNEGIARAADMVPQLGRWIRRQVDPSIPELESKDPSGIRAALDYVGIPVGDLEAQKQKYGIEEGPARRIGGTAARIAGEMTPFIPIGPVKSAVKGAAYGVGLGTVGNEIAGPTGELAGTVLSIPLAARSAAKSVAPTVDDLKATATNAFKRAQDEGIVVTQGSFAKYLNDLGDVVVKRNFDKDFHPMAFKVFNKFADDLQKGDLTLNHIMKLREFMNEAKGAATKPKDAAMIKVMRNELDNYIANLSSRDMTVFPGASGDLGTAVSSFREGREAWRRARGAETVEKLMENARTNAGKNIAPNLDSSIRQEFARLIKDPQQKAFFTPAEWAALEKVAKGGPVQNTMRQLGRLAPQNLLTTLVMANIHPAMVGASIAGAGARAGSAKATLRNAQKADDAIRGAPPTGGLLDYIGRMVSSSPGVAGSLGAQWQQEER
jgi:hypothetical protein